jgi:hypothetical protein
MHVRSGVVRPPSQFSNVRLLMLSTFAHSCCVSPNFNLLGRTNWPMERKAPQSAQESERTVFRCRWQKGRITLTFRQIKDLPNTQIVTTLFRRSGGRTIPLKRPGNRPPQSLPAEVPDTEPRDLFSFLFIDEFHRIHHRLSPLAIHRPTLPCRRFSEMSAPSFASASAMSLSGASFISTSGAFHRQLPT